MFQFQTGSIKSKAIKWLIGILALMFQFQTGSIKSPQLPVQEPAAAVWVCFNSKLVRLKAVSTSQKDAQSC